MADAIVQTHIDTFLQSASPEEARAAIEVSNTTTTVTNLSVINITTNYTLSLSDNGAYIRISPSDNVVVTVPSGTWPLGSGMVLKNTSAYTMGVSAAAGVTLYYSTSSFGPLGITQLVNVGANTWDVL